MRASKMNGLEELENIWIQFVGVVCDLKVSKWCCRWNITPPPPKKKKKKKNEKLWIASRQST